jgi:hypothetical protein
MLNGDKEDDADEEGDLQFGHLLDQPVKLLRLQGDMTHQVCWKKRFFVVVKNESFVGTNECF